MIRRAGAAYQRLLPTERALAIRLVQRACNQRHNQWSARFPKTAYEPDERLTRALHVTGRWKSRFVSDPAREVKPSESFKRRHAVSE